MPNDGVVYHPLGLGVGLGVPPGGAIEGEQGRGQVPMMRTEWWWQPGPVTSCCWFFSLRTGEGGRGRRYTSSPYVYSHIQKLVETTAALDYLPTLYRVD